MHELDQPGKADFWHDNCHAWYVVAPAAGIVRPEELPPGWGLMLPNTRSKVRFDIAVRATVRDDVVPSWLAVRSIMARHDTLQRGAIDQAKAEGAAVLLGPLVAEYRRLRHLPMSGSAAVDTLLRELTTMAVEAGAGSGWLCTDSRHYRHGTPGAHRGPAPRRRNHYQRRRRRDR